MTREDLLHKAMWVKLLQPAKKTLPFLLVTMLLPLFITKEDLNIGRNAEGPLPDGTLQHRV